jgi:hypothetical protein
MHAVWSAAGGVWFPACMTARIWAAMLAIYTSSQVASWGLGRALAAGCGGGGDGRHVVFGGGGGIKESQFHSHLSKLPQGTVSYYNIV